MRYTPEHKQETHARIVREASRQFRRRGARGLAIPDLMSKLDLTHGGFYKHFDSKQQLLTEAVAKAFDDAESRFQETVSKAKPGAEIRTLIENYMTLEHCANPAEGCPMAALASDIARFPRPVRNEIEKAIKERVKSVARYMPGATENERRRKGMALMSGMIGALNIARALVDPEARKTALEASKEFYIKAFCK